MAFFIKNFQKIILTLLLFWMVPVSAQFDFEIIGNADKSVFKTVKILLDTPEDEIDFTHAILTLDKIVDPSVNYFKGKNRLARMVSDIKKLSISDDSIQKKEALIRYLYEAGSWNDNTPFRYDFDDPLGTKLENKLISNYLDSKKGNCVSMPFLFIALGQQLGLNVTASTAPLHVFVKFTDDATNKTVNLETTSGANEARNEWYRQQFPISDLAIRSGIYLKTLNKQETLTVMVTTLLEHFKEEGEYAQVIVLSDLLLSYNPSHISARVHLASAHNELLKKYGVWQYRSPQSVPEDKRHFFNYLVPRINWYHREAKKLGWRPLTQKENENYLKTVRKEAVK